MPGGQTHEDIAMRKPSFSQSEMDNKAADQVASLRVNKESTDRREPEARKRRVKTQERSNSSGEDSAALLAELELRTGFGGNLDFAPSEFVLNPEEGNVEFWKAETVKLRGYLSKARVDNKRLEGEAEELAENYGKLMNKYNKATTAAIMARSQRGISEATIKDDFEDLSRQLSGWVDEISYALEFSDNANTVLDSLLRYLGFPATHHLSLTKNCVGNIITAWLWHRILTEVFPSTSKATDLWATTPQSQTIFDVSSSMLAAGDSGPEIQSWLCMTANALMSGRFLGNDRTATLASTLWSEISLLWQTDAANSRIMVRSLHEDVVAAAVSFSLQLRKGRSSMNLQFPSISTSSTKAPDELGEGELCLSPELNVAAGGAAKDDGSMVVVQSKRRTLQWKRKGV